MAKPSLKYLAYSWNNPRWTVVKEGEKWWADAPCPRDFYQTDRGFDTFEEAIVHADKEARK